MSEAHADARHEREIARIRQAKKSKTEGPKIQAGSGLDEVFLEALSRPFKIVWKAFQRHW
jgi:hypothetical protein